MTDKPKTLSEVSLQGIFNELLQEEYNYHIFIYKSGRSAGKSWSIATILLMKALQKKLRILCCREHGIKLHSSAKKQLEDNIAQLGLDDWFEVQDKKIICPSTGSTFEFTGLNENPTAIQGYANLSVVWIDEAQAISYPSWRKLRPTVLRNDGSIIIVSMNPELEHDCLYVESVNPTNPEDTYVRETSYKNNKYLPPQMLAEIEALKRTNYQEYLHVYGGQVASTSDRQIFQNISVDNMDGYISPTDQLYVGIDYGFTDPTAFIGVYYFEERHTIYIAHEFYETELAWEQIIPSLDRSIPGVIRCKIITDSNEKRITKHLRDNNYDASCASKGAKSVIEGIRFFQANNLIINPRCKHSIREFSTFRWDIDKQTEKIKVNVPAPNQSDHLISAGRYALEAQRKKYTSRLHMNPKSYKPAIVFMPEDQADQAIVY